uniref:regulator of MON1-CCZ1 complex n=1 Tax=Ciona intestinalis TaxID=7719 RepID=UPI000180BDB1|nr:regulator of MON1-CCZ1 complex [Ciona intestinalis]|eukprot:XP_002121064.1 regulator of MON1-CCZ1 complex [Ciona intestinalis]
MEGKHYLELGKNPVRFDPVGVVTNVFFDESNKMVFVVRSGGETGVIVKGPTDKKSFTFRLKDKGALIAIKFSLEQKVLSMQRSEKCVEFANFKNGEPDRIEYSQTCKGKNNKILTFHWLSPNEVVFVTIMGVEFYQVNMEKRLLKLIKGHYLTILWATYSPETSVLLVSSTSNLLVPFYFNNGQVTRLQKFQVELSRSGQPKLELMERDVTLLNLYNTLYVGVLKRPTSPTTPNMNCTLDLFQLSRDSHVRKPYILQLGLSGRFAFNVVDNLIVAHHQVSKTSVVFDIKLPGLSKSNVLYLEPLIAPLPIKSFKIEKEEFDPQMRRLSFTEVECQMYPPTWIVFQPNIIIDACLGCMWYLKINLSTIVDMFPDRCLLLDFLILRKQSKPTILHVCKQALTPLHQLPLQQISSLLSKLNQVARDYIDMELSYLQKLEAQPDNPVLPSHRDCVVIDQNDMLTHVLTPFVGDCDVIHTFKIAIMMEYLKSLELFRIKTKPLVHELLIDTLVQGGEFLQLQQLIRHRVLEDSKRAACKLLSLESAHAPCSQLALDMLKRLATSDDEVIEVLLSKQQVLPALRFIRSVGMHDLVPARKFLEASMHDDMTFYSVYKFFEARNIRINKRPGFTDVEKCQPFMLHYQSKFTKREKRTRV